MTSAAPFEVTQQPAESSSYCSSLRASLRNVLLRSRPRPLPTFPERIPVLSTSLPPHGPSDVEFHLVHLPCPDDLVPSQSALPVLLCTSTEPQNSPRPAIALLHSTAKCAASLAASAAELARHGFLVAAPDGRFHGHRAKGYTGPESALRCAAVYQEAISDAFLSSEDIGRPFVYDAAADMFYLADYLCARPDVSNIGITGVSLGGMTAWLAAAADERWDATAPLIGVQSFGWAINEKCVAARARSIPVVFQTAAREGEEVFGETVAKRVWDKICPGLLEYFDAENTLLLLAPRYLFIGNGEMDDRCPAEGLRTAFQKLRALYGSGECLVLKTYKGTGHELTPEMWDDVVRWLRKVLVAGPVLVRENECDINVAS